MSTTITIRVGAGSKDNLYKQNSGGTPSLSNTANDSGVGLFDSNQTALGSQFEFDSIVIPNATTINSAKITFIASSSDSTTTVNSKIRGIAADNASIPTTTGGGGGSFEAPPFTTAVISWNSIGSWVGGNSYDTPDITAIIQEIVNRVGWVSGNNIVISWDDIDKNSTQTGTGNKRTAESYDNVPANAALLTINYGAGISKAQGASFLSFLS